MISLIFEVDFFGYFESLFPKKIIPHDSSMNPVLVLILFLLLAFLYYEINILAIVCFILLICYLLCEYFMKRMIFVFLCIIPLCVFLLLFVIGVGTRHEYNIGCGTTSEDYLQDVVVTLSPKGIVPVPTELNYTNGGWLMMETNWPVPSEITVTFIDTQKKEHILNGKFQLPENFRGDIVVIIHKEEESYVLKTFIGKRDELDIQAICKILLHDKSIGI